ncbi:MAG: hypothetical protein JW856_06155 [Dehalococcoidales bacterium]|nr:hypothetical protein [Dehalococcoidales bacterium]
MEKWYYNGIFKKGQKVTITENIQVYKSTFLDRKGKIKILNIGQPAEIIEISEPVTYGGQWAAPVYDIKSDDCLYHSIPEYCLKAIDTE